MPLTKRSHPPLDNSPTKKKTLDTYFRNPLRSLDGDLQRAQAGNKVVEGGEDEPQSAVVIDVEAHVEDNIEDIVEEDEKSEDEDEWEVEEIFKHRINRDGSITYFVRWRGYSCADDTWEPSENLDNCSEIIEAYEKKLGEVGESVEATVQGSAYMRERYLSKGDVFEFSVAPTLNRCQAIKVVVNESKTKGTLPSHIIAIKSWQANVNEICEKAKVARVIVTNTVDSEGPPSHYTFRTDMQISEAVADKFEKGGATNTTIGCSCKDCTSGESECCPQFVLNKDAKLSYRASTKRVKVEQGQAIIECNSQCQCDATCANRVVQYGRQVPLEIFKTKEKGWGVRAVNKITKGTFIEEYIGELLTSEAAEERSNLTPEACTYLYDLDFHDGEPDFTIDAKNCGNAAHFFNHSCDPNMANFSVYVEVQDSRLPRIALFAARDIKKGEEMTFDYRCDLNTMGDTPTPSKLHKVIDCKCGANNCRGNFRQ